MHVDTDQARPVSSTSSPGTAASPSSTSVPTNSPGHGDPDEVDISEHLYEPKTAARKTPATAEPTISEAQLRQMMLGFDTPRQSTPGAGGAGGGTGTPGGPGGNAANFEDDPIMKMMSQMMGGAGAGGTGFPPGSSPFPGMPAMSGMPGQPQPVAQGPSSYHTFWRLIHTIVALGLGLYVAFLTPFTGTKIERESAAMAHAQHLAVDDENEHNKRMFFWLFATSEAVLLTTRFFFDKGRAPPPGIMWTIVGFVPEPFKGYLSVVLRYGQYFTTVRTDILTCMFVLGVCSWLRS